MNDKPGTIRLFFKYFGLIPLIFFLVASIFFGIGLGIWVHGQKFVSQAQETTASVLDKSYNVRRDSDGDTSTYYYADLKFTTHEGRQMEVHANVGKSFYNRHTAGDQATIWYAASDPSWVKTSLSQDSIFAWIFTGVGIVFGLPALVFMVLIWRHAGDASFAYRQGTPIVATIDSVDATNTQINNQQMYRIYWTTQDLRKGKSRMLRYDEVADLNKGQTIQLTRGRRKDWYI